MDAAALTPGAELWYGGGALCGLTHQQLQVSGSSNPAIVVSTSSLTTISDVAFDTTGNAWVVGTGSDSIFRFPVAALTKSGTAQPDLVVRSSALKSPGNLVFDAEGALWVASRPLVASSTTEAGAVDATTTEAGTIDASATEAGAMSEGSIFRFDIPSGMSGMQDLTPTARISSATAGDLFEIGSIAFDAAENLWVTSFVGLLRFDSPRSRSGDVALAPGAVIDKRGFTNDIYFYSIAFDPSGALWAASGDGFHYLTSVTEFKNPGALTGRSSPAAAATIQGALDVLPAGGLAFDRAGNLWEAISGSILMYSGTGALSGTVSPAPATTLTVTGQAVPTTNSHLVFFPSPTLQQDAGQRDSAADTGAPAPGNATGTFTFSNVVGSNGDSTPISSSSGAARLTAPQQDGSTGGASQLAISLNTMPARAVSCNVWGPFMVGATYMLANTGTPASYCTYSELGAGVIPDVFTDTQWISNGGTLTIDAVMGKTFTFSVHAATMVVNPAFGNNTATGTFSMDGNGTATLP